MKPLIVALALALSCVVAPAGIASAQGLPDEARASSTATACRANAGGGADPLERRVERADRVEGHRVHTLGPVERDDAPVRARFLDEDVRHRAAIAGSAGGVNRRA
jgi:hypothetical protein